MPYQIELTKTAAKQFIYDIYDAVLVVDVIAVGHRKEIYG